MKKRFADMTQQEIKNMSEEEFDQVSPFEKKSCYDCKFLMTSLLSLLCINDNAFKDRLTLTPGCIKCPHWEPNWNYIDEKYKQQNESYEKHN